MIPPAVLRHLPWIALAAGLAGFASLLRHALATAGVGRRPVLLAG